MPDPPATLQPNPSQPHTPNPLSSQSDLVSASSSPQPQWSIPLSPTITVKPTSNAPALASVPPPPPPPAPMVSYAPTLVSGGAVVPPVAASFRPVLQFLPMSNPGLTNPNYQNPVGVRPSGVSMAVCGGFGTAQMSVPQPMLPYQFSPGQPPRPYPPPMPNGYPAVPHGTVPPFGLSRYPSPYIPMVHPPFPPRPPGVINVLPAVSQSQIPGVPGFPCPIIPPVVMSIIPTVTPAEKPQTIVYVGKIASIVENDFILSLLQLCGPVKSWKRAQDPTDGTPKGFGFCEFDSAEGVLRALRLLSKFNIDGQELVLNVNQATKEYLEWYVDKQSENLKKLKDAQAAEPKKGEETAVIVRENETMKSSVEDSNKEENGLGKKENNDFSSFGIVTNEDKEADQVALDKLTSITEERLKTRPLPPPPPPPKSTGVGSGNLNSDVPAKSRDGDSEMRNNAAEDKNDGEITSETKLASEHDRPERSSPDRSRRFDWRSRDRDRGRDLKREKEWEIERYERETERERVRKERELRKKIEEAEHQYEECLKEWEYREREREKQQYEREKEKEREYKRKEIKIDEDDDNGDSRRRWHRNMLEDKRRRRLREKEDDLTDRNKEEEEITEAKKRADEHQEKVQRDALKVLSKNVTNESNVMKKIEKTELAVASSTEINDKLDNILEEVYEGASACKSHIGEAIVQNSTGEESTILLIAASDTRHAGNAPAKKLGFGLVGSGKRTAVPSVFHEDDDDARKEKRMRPLVPIDYSTEELEAVHPTVPGALSPNLAAAAEFAKRISNVNPKVEKLDVERERSRHFHHKLSQRDRDRGDENLKNCTRDDNKGKILDREQGLDKVKTQDNKKLTSLKQLIDMIPRTKEELFSHEINWAVYEKHELHERMRPWILKKITEFLGEEETTLVDYIVSSTQEHVKASQMLELLQSILDDEAEMFVLKMWRMLIYEIKRVEADLTLK